jgi:hypothetical protein
VSRTTSLLRATVVAGAAVALLAGCFNVTPPTPSATPTEKPEPDFGTIGGETPIPIETGTPIDPVDPATTGFTTVIDDLGVLAVTIPEDWDDVNGVPFTTDAGQQWASITAAPDVDGYLSSWSVSGIEIGATAVQGATNDQLLGLMESITGIYDTCETTVSEAAPYDDGFYTGFESVYEGCGGDTVAFAITAMNKAGTAAVFIRAQITGDYDANEVYTQVVQSFDTSFGRARNR